nr:MAG TPA: hypothetical protein [Caudoviricetes sp.]DAY39991.1 MAG TPA: hypothetical protein [Bacteriophage sp.]
MKGCIACPSTSAERNVTARKRRTQDTRRCRKWTFL